MRNARRAAGQTLEVSKSNRPFSFQLPVCPWRQVPRSWARPPTARHRSSMEQMSILRSFVWVEEHDAEVIAVLATSATHTKES